MTREAVAKRIWCASNLGTEQYRARVGSMVVTGAWHEVEALLWVIADDLPKYDGLKWDGKTLYPARKLLMEGARNVS